MSLFVAGAILGEVLVSFFVTGAVLDEVLVLLFVAGAVLGEVLVSLLVAGAVRGESVTFCGRCNTWSSSRCILFVAGDSTWFPQVLVSLLRGRCSTRW